MLTMMILERFTSQNVDFKWKTKKKILLYYGHWWNDDLIQHVSSKIIFVFFLFGRIHFIFKSVWSWRCMLYNFTAKTKIDKFLFKVIFIPTRFGLKKSRFSFSHLLCLFFYEIFPFFSFIFFGSVSSSSSEIQKFIQY